MLELVRTNDVVMISAISALLDGAGIEYLVADQNMSVVEGTLGFIQRRILVLRDDLQEARTVLQDAGLEKELRGND